jgi:hypothetical protein
VQRMNLDTLRFLHRMSYGHRGRRTVMVVVHDPQAVAVAAGAAVGGGCNGSGLQHLEAEVRTRRVYVREGECVCGKASVCVRSKW